MYLCTGGVGVSMKEKGPSHMGGDAKGWGWGV